MRGDGRRALILGTFLLACTHARPSDPPPQPSSSACIAERFSAGMMPAPRDASVKCREGDVAACKEECGSGAATACSEAGDPGRACELGSLPACTSIAAEALKGEPSNIDKPCARALLDVACNARVPDACARLGLALLEGEGGSKAPGRARDVLERSCDALGRSPCRILGVLLNRGAFGSKEPTLGATALRRGCDTGDAEACALLHDKH
ncbi:MAG: tetratricopeptide repeat protein [Polyangiales bacterium]